MMKLRIQDVGSVKLACLFIQALFLLKQEGDILMIYACTLVYMERIKVKSASLRTCCFRNVYA